MDNSIKNRVCALFFAAAMMINLGPAQAESLDETNAQVTQGAITAVVTEPIDTAKYEEALNAVYVTPEMVAFYEYLNGEGYDAGVNHIMTNLYAFDFTYLATCYANDKKICPQENDSHPIIFDPSDTLYMMAALNPSQDNLNDIFWYNEPLSLIELVKGFDNSCTNICNYFERGGVVPLPIKLLKTKSTKTNLDENDMNKRQKIDKQANEKSENTFDIANELNEGISELNDRRKKDPNNEKNADDFLKLLCDLAINNKMESLGEQGAKFCLAFIESFIKTATPNEMTIHDGILKGYSINADGDEIIVVTRHGKEIPLNSKSDNDLLKRAVFEQNKNSCDGTLNLANLLMSCERPDLAIAIGQETNPEWDFYEIVKKYTSDLSTINDRYSDIIPQINEAVDGIRRELEDYSKFETTVEQMRRILENNHELHSNVSQSVSNGIVTCMASVDSPKICNNYK